MSKLLQPHVTHLRASGCAKATRESRERLLSYADSRLPYGVDTPTTEELATFLADGGWTGWTLCTYYRHLKGFYTWAVDGGHISWNPIVTIKAPKQPDADPDPVSDDEMRQALEQSDEMWQLIIMLAAYAGLRASEIARCRREDIRDGVIVVAGKGAKTKRLPCHPEIWRRVEHMPPGLLFPSSAGRVIDLTNRARWHFDKIGLHEVHLHRFRHWYATSLLNRGANIRVVQELMRHEDISSTAIYTKVTDEQRRLAIDTLPALTPLAQEDPDQEDPLQEAA